MKKMKTKEAALFETVFFMFPVFLCFGITVLLKGYNLYFADFSLDLGYTGSLIVAVLICTITQLRINMNPIMKSTKIGVITGSVMTIEMLFFILFLQYHLAIALIIATLFIFFSVWLRRKIVAINSNHTEMTQEKYKWCKHRSDALASFTLCIVLLIPSAVGVYEEYHKHSLSTETWSSFVEWFNTEDESEENTVPHEDKLNGIAKWDSLSLSKKERIIRSVALLEKGNLGIDDNVEIKVSAEKMPDNTCGYYTNGTKEIFINYKYLNEADLYDVLRTVSHEMHHAFVFYTVETLDFNSESVKNSYYFKRAREWKDNTENYVSADSNFIEYENQPIEADARAYAQERVEEYRKLVNSFEE